MNIEQRAHEVALEIMKMHFDVNRSNYEIAEKSPDGQIDIPSDLLVRIYSIAYHYVIEIES